jgi:TPR repeat protein
MCVAELRKFGVEQACPLCRTPLPSKAEKLYDEATRRYVTVRRMVGTGRASWSMLPDWAQYEMRAAIMGWRAAAQEGHAEAQLRLGFMIGIGRGVAQSDEEAVKWYRMAADQGLAQAQYNLGFRFANGRGVAQSDEEAIKWYSKAADQGNCSCAA